MIPYNEIREDAEDSYRERYEEYGVSLSSCFYGYLWEYECGEKHNIIERLCVYACFICTLIEKGEDYNFLIEEFSELKDKINFKEVEKELGHDDYSLLEKDLDEISRHTKM